MNLLVWEFGILNRKAILDNVYCYASESNDHQKVTVRNCSSPFHQQPPPRQWQLPCPLPSQAVPQSLLPCCGQIPILGPCRWYETCTHQMMALSSPCTASNSYKGTLPDNIYCMYVCMYVCMYAYYKHHCTEIALCGTDTIFFLNVAIRNIHLFQ